MPTPTKGKRLGGSPAHERAILANLATSLFEHGRITTTETRARRLRPFAERLITKARRGDLHSRRHVMRTIRDKDVVHVLFTEIGPRFANRPGGYTRITKVGPRPGDNAAMAVIELVEELSEGTGTQQRSPQAAAAAAPEATGEATTTEDTTADEAAAAEDVGSAVETAAGEESADVEAATADDEAAAAETLTGEESADDEVEAEGAAEGTETENTDEDSTKS